MSLRLLCAMILLATAAACGGHASSSRDANVAGGGSGGEGGDAGGAGAGGAELTCPVSDSGRFEATPTGACEGTGSCAIELDNSCRPGVSIVPATAAVFECDCVSNQWRCVVKSGGLGLISCGDAGGPGQG